MSDIAIRVENLSKRYRRGLPSGNDRLSEALSNLGRAMLHAPRRLRGPSTEGATPEAERSGEFWALKDVSFEVKRGEVVGIIGRNGAGKSTLLKILSRITEPTSGRFGLAGRVGSLLEVGTGFHPELTGRENVFLNGTFLGMSRREIARKFDAIAAFAEIDDFLDTPVKRYSSGMQVRLGFAVAAHLDPDILIVDEALAVGDAAFQKKCLGKIEGMAGSGRAVLFVSHSSANVRKLCARAIWIHEGRAQREGTVDEVLHDYHDFVSGHDGVFRTTSTDGVFEQASESDGVDFVLRRVVLKNQAGQPCRKIFPGEPLTVELHYHARHRIDKPIFWISLSGKHGPLFAANMVFDDHCPEFIEGEGIIACTFQSLPLVPTQTYTVRVGIGACEGHISLFLGRDVAQIRVVGSMNALGFPGSQADALAAGSVSMILPYSWHLPCGRKIRVDGFKPRAGLASEGNTSLETAASEADPLQQGPCPNQ